MKEYRCTGLPPTDEELNEIAAEGWEIVIVLPAGPSPQASYTRIIWERPRPDTL